jgi:hypothetical protein
MFNSMFYYLILTAQRLNSILPETTSLPGLASISKPMIALLKGETLVDAFKGWTISKVEDNLDANACLTAKDAPVLLELFQCSCEDLVPQRFVFFSEVDCRPFSH